MIKTLTYRKRIRICRTIAKEIDQLIETLEDQNLGQLCSLDTEISGLRKAGYRLIEKLHQLRAEAA